MGDYLRQYQWLTIQPLVNEWLTQQKTDSLAHALDTEYTLSDYIKTFHETTTLANDWNTVGALLDRVVQLEKNEEYKAGLLLLGRVHQLLIYMQQKFTQRYHTQQSQQQVIMVDTQHSQQQLNMVIRDYVVQWYMDYMRNQFVRQVGQRVSIVRSSDCLQQLPRTEVFSPCTTLQTIEVIDSGFSIGALMNVLVRLKDLRDYSPHKLYYKRDETPASDVSLDPTNVFVQMETCDTASVGHSVLYLPYKLQKLNSGNVRTAFQDYVLGLMFPATRTEAIKRHTEGYKLAAEDNDWQYVSSYVQPLDAYPYQLPPFAFIARSDGESRRRSITATESVFDVWSFLPIDLSGREISGSMTYLPDNVSNALQPMETFPQVLVLAPQTTHYPTSSIRLQTSFTHSIGSDAQVYQLFGAICVGNNNRYTARVYLPEAPTIGYIEYSQDQNAQYITGAGLEFSMSQIALIIYKQRDYNSDKVNDPAEDKAMMYGILEYIHPLQQQQQQQSQSQSEETETDERVYGLLQRYQLSDNVIRTVMNELNKVKRMVSGDDNTTRINSVRSFPH
jgi:hypothetical protein